MSAEVTSAAQAMLQKHKYKTMSAAPTAQSMLRKAERIRDGRGSVDDLTTCGSFSQLGSIIGTAQARASGSAGLGSAQAFAASDSSQARAPAGRRRGGVKCQLKSDRARKLMKTVDAGDRQAPSACSAQG